MPNDNTDKKQPMKPMKQPDVDQKKPQSAAIGQSHGVANKKAPMKPDQKDQKDDAAQPQSRGIVDKSKDLDDLPPDTELDDEDDTITQRTAARRSEPQRPQ